MQILHFYWKCGKLILSLSSGKSSVSLEYCIQLHLRLQMFVWEEWNQLCFRKLIASGILFCITLILNYIITVCLIQDIGANEDFSD